MQWLYSYILISHTLLCRADCGNTPSDVFHVVTCGVKLIVPFDFLEGSGLQPTCVQHCPLVLNFIQAHPPGQRENQKWKAKIALLILHSSVSFWLKKKKKPTTGPGLESRIAGAEAWQQWQTYLHTIIRYKKTGFRSREGHEPGFGPWLHCLKFRT